MTAPPLRSRPGSDARLGREGRGGAGVVCRVGLFCGVLIRVGVQTVGNYVGKLGNNFVKMSVRTFGT